MQDQSSFGENPTYDIPLLKPNEYCLIFVLIFDLHGTCFAFVYCALTLFHDSALLLIAKVHSCSHFVHLS